MTFIDDARKLIAGTKKKTTFFEPCREWKTTGNAELGEKALDNGQVGCLIAAGGLGSRLGLKDVPKGVFPVTMIKHKSLFQLFCEKAKAAKAKYGKPLPLAFMTSPLNHQQTVEFFEKNDFFGLPKKDLFFFSQGSLPYLDDHGEILTGPIPAPDGNGKALHYFCQNGLFDVWKQRGIQTLTFVPIDNPLADPFDSELIGLLLDGKNQIVCKCALRESENEKVGVVVRIEGRLAVVEYTEFPKNTVEKFPLANLSLFAFDFDFVKFAGMQEMPLHAVRKESGTGIAWKFEYFIFDVLPFASKVEILLASRERTFAPLKNSSGHDTIDDVRKALQNEDRRIFLSLTGKEPPNRPFELAQEFYYPTEATKRKWKGRKLPNEAYVEA